MSAVSSLPSDDPYEPRPTWAQRHPDVVAAGAVFVLTVLLAVISFPPFEMPQFAYAMLVPGAYWAYLRPGWKLYAGTLFAAQAVAWTIILGWLHHVTWGGLALLGPFIGAWIGTWYLAAWWILPRMVGRPTLTRLTAMVGLAAAWVVIEWSRTWLLGGFPWLPLAASQWKMVSMLQIAAYTGAVGVSFVVVAVNLGFAAYTHRLFREGAKGLGKRSQEFFLALFFVLVCFSVQLQETYGRVRFNVPFARVAFVQPYIPQDVKWDPAKGPGILKILEEQTLAAASSRPDLILWPEASTPLALRGDPTAAAFANTLVARARTPLLAGSIAIEDAGTPRERWFNGAFLVTPEGGVQKDYYAKRQLVPFGEFVPFRPVLGWLSKFVPIGDDFARGLDSAPVVVPLKANSAVFGPLICYEDIYPDLARRSVLAGSEVLAVLTNNGWFGEGGAAYQHAAHSVLRAVETRRPVLRCGNGGWSGWIDEFGLVREEIRGDTGTIYFRGNRTLSLQRDRRWIGRESFYVEHGDWFVAVCACLTLWGFAALWLAPPAKPAEPVSPV